jgi:hypothetical protein
MLATQASTVVQTKKRIEAPKSVANKEEKSQNQRSRSRKSKKEMKMVVDEQSA